MRICLDSASLFPQFFPPLRRTASDRGAEYNEELQDPGWRPVIHRDAHVTFTGLPDASCCRPPPTPLQPTPMVLACVRAPREILRPTHGLLQFPCSANFPSGLSPLQANFHHYRHDNPGLSNSVRQNHSQWRVSRARIPSTPTRSLLTPLIESKNSSQHNQSKKAHRNG